LGFIANRDGPSVVAWFGQFVIMQFDYDVIKLEENQVSLVTSHCKTYQNGVINFLFSNSLLSFDLVVTCNLFYFLLYYYFLLENYINTNICYSTLHK